MTATNFDRAPWNRMGTRAELSTASADSPRHFILVAIGTAGDVFPFIGTGQALRAGGHRVSIMTHSKYGEWVQRAGLTLIDLDDEVQHRRMVEHRLFGSTVFSGVVTVPWVIDSMHRQYEKLESHYVAGETVIVSIMTAFGARIFQEVRDAPNWTALIWPMALRSEIRPSLMPYGWWPQWLPRWGHRSIYRIIDGVGIDRALAGIGQFRKELGLPSVSRYLHEWCYSPDGVLGFFPDWFVKPIPEDWPPQLRFTGFPLFDAADGVPVDAEVERFLASGPPPVLVTGGSWLRRPGFYTSAIAGCRRAGLRCLVQTPFVELLPPSPDPDTLLVRYVPFSAVLPRSAALVHHGGIGTLSQGMAAGVPQVIIPQNFDQRDNAAYACRLGIGRWPANGHAGASTIARALTQALNDPEVAEANRTYSARLSVAATAERIRTGLKDLKPSVAS